MTRRWWSWRRSDPFPHPRHLRLPLSTTPAGRLRRELDDAHAGNDRVHRVGGAALRAQREFRRRLAVGVRVSARHDAPAAGTEDPAHWAAGNRIAAASTRRTTSGSRSSAPGAPVCPLPETSSNAEAGPEVLAWVKVTGLPFSPLAEAVVS